VGGDASCKRQRYIHCISHGRCTEGNEGLGRAQGDSHREGPFALIIGIEGYKRQEGEEKREHECQQLLPLPLYGRGMEWLVMRGAQWL